MITNLFKSLKKHAVKILKIVKRQAVNFIEYVKSTVRGEQNLAKVPALPDDLLMSVFGQLTTEEREPLGTSCKRFRNLDFEVGSKHFDIIHVNSRFNGLFITGTKPDGEYFLNGNIFYNDYKSLLTNHNVRMFRNARATTLKIELARINDEELLFLIPIFLKSVSYQELDIEFHCEDLCCEQVFMDLIRDHNLKNSRVYLKWNSVSPRNTIPCSKEILKKLPVMDKIKIAEKNNYTKVSKIIIDEDALLHITLHSNHAELRKVYCTGQGVMKAFEAVSHSSHPSKYVIFECLQSTIEDLSSMRELHYDERSPGCLVNRRRHAILKATLVVVDQKTCSWMIEMGKMDEWGELRHEEVRW